MTVAADKDSIPTTLQTTLTDQHKIDTLKTIQKWNIVFSMPFWYGAITRLPFIYFVVHMRLDFNLEWVPIGFYVGAYQATRALTNIFAIILTPMQAHIGGTLIGLAGNIIVLSADTSEKVPFLVGTIIVGFSETMACMQTYVKAFTSKDISALEFQLKAQYAVVCFAAFFAFGVGGVTYQKFGIKGVACLGTILSSLEMLSIFLYIFLKRAIDAGDASIPGKAAEAKKLNQKKHIEGGDAQSDESDNFKEVKFSVTSTDVAVVDNDLPRIDEEVGNNKEDGKLHSPGSSLLYKKPPNEIDSKKSVSFGKSMATSTDGIVELGGSKTSGMSEDASGSISVSSNSGRAKSTRFPVPDDSSDDAPTRTKKRSESDKIRDSVMLQMVDLFLDSGFGANSLSYLLCITIGMEAITIGYNLAIEPIYITQQFNVNSSTVGLVIASGAALGTIISSFVTLTETGKRLMKSYLPSPNNLIISMGAIAVSVLIAAAPLFYIHIIGVIMLMAWNDFASILLNEMQGKVTAKDAYLTVGPLGQVIRRSLNVVTAITGPILYGVYPQLPYFVAGVVTGLWTIVLVVVLLRRSNANYNIIRKAKGIKKGDEERKKKVQMKMSFSRQEIIARQLKRGILSGSNVYDDDLPAHLNYPIAIDDDADDTLRMSSGRLDQALEEANTV